MVLACVADWSRPNVVVVVELPQGFIASCSEWCCQWLRTGGGKWESRRREWIKKRRQVLLSLTAVDLALVTTGCQLYRCAVDVEAREQCRRRHRRSRSVLRLCSTKLNGSRRDEVALCTAMTVFLRRGMGLVAKLKSCRVS